MLKGSTGWSESTPDVLAVQPFRDAGEQRLGVGGGDRQTAGHDRESFLRGAGEDAQQRGPGVNPAVLPDRNRGRTHRFPGHKTKGGRVNGRQQIGINRR